jgi:uncharacterized protein
MALSFMKLFMPKDKVFYGLFEEVADNVAKMSKLLITTVSEPDFDKRQGFISQLEVPGKPTEGLRILFFSAWGVTF